MLRIVAFVLLFCFVSLYFIMLCIACPQSQHGRTRHLWPYWRDQLAKADVDATWIPTRHPGHAVELARGATEPVVAVGGDGTINEVLTGLLSANSNQPMGVLYAGTSPDFCRFHHLPTDPQAAMHTLLAGKVKPVDTIRIRHADRSGSKKTAYFACSSNVGFGAAVARFSNRYRKFLGDFPGTLLGVLRAFVTTRPIDVTLELDGQEYRFRRCNHLILVKNPRIASGLQLDLPLVPDDGQAYALVVHDLGRFGLCCQLPKFYSGRIAESEAIFLQPFQRARVRTTQPMLARSRATGSESKMENPSQATGLTRLKNTQIEVEYDGDPHGFLPLEAEILPKSLKLIGAETDDARK